jgi:hypothetical protein
MKKIKLLITACSIFLFNQMQAQVVVDGSIDAAEGYTSLSTYTANNTGFGDHGIKEMLVKAEGRRLNVFLKGECEWNGNNFILFIDVPGRTGIPLGSALPSGDDPQSPFAYINTKMDMQCDYAFRVASSNFWQPIDGVIYPSLINYTKTYAGVYQDHYLDSTLSKGTLLNCNFKPKTGQVATSQFNTIKLAYKKVPFLSNVVNEGMEISLDADSLGIASCDSVTLFAVYVNPDGKYFSANCLPEITGQNGAPLGSDGAGNGSATGANFNFANMAGTQAIKYKVCLQAGIENINAVNQIAIYPNPASNNIKINYNLASSTTVTVRIVNLLGAEIVNLGSSLQSSGVHFANYDISNITNGNYFVEVSSEKGKQVQKLTILK